MGLTPAICTVLCFMLSACNSTDEPIEEALSNAKPEMMAQGGLSVAGRCRCLTKDSNTSIEKEGYIPYSLQA